MSFSEKPKEIMKFKIVTPPPPNRSWTVYSNDPCLVWIGKCIAYQHCFTYKNANAKIIDCLYTKLQPSNATLGVNSDKFIPTFYGNTYFNIGEIIHRYQDNFGGIIISVP